MLWRLLLSSLVGLSLCAAELVKLRRFRFVVVFVLWVGRNVGIVLWYVFLCWALISRGIACGAFKLLSCRRPTMRSSRPRLGLFVLSILAGRGGLTRR